MMLAHDENFYQAEDTAVASMGDKVPDDDPNAVKDRLAQKFYDESREDEVARIERDTERLYQLAMQEGVIIEELEDPDGYQVYYNRVWRYIESGGDVPTWEWEDNEGGEYLKAFYVGLQNIEKRDEAGEWVKDCPFGVGQDIPKVEA